MPILISLACVRSMPHYSSTTPITKWPGAQKNPHSMSESGPKFLNSSLQASCICNEIRRWNRWRRAIFTYDTTSISLSKTKTSTLLEGFVKRLSQLSEQGYENVFSPPKHAIDVFQEVETMRSFCGNGDGSLCVGSKLEATKWSNLSPAVGKYSSSLWKSEHFPSFLIRSSCSSSGCK